MAILLCGCAHRAKIATWRPADVSVSDLKNLAVLGMSGAPGETVAAVLISRLRDSALTAQVEFSEFPAVRPVSATTGDHGSLSPADLHAARAAGIDGIILAEVVAYRCEEHPVAKKPFSWGWTLGTDQPAAEDDTGGQEQTETTSDLRRDATVAVTFRIVDTNTGKTRTLRQTSHSLNEKTSGEGGRDQRPRADVLQHLTRECVDEFVCALAPHRSDETVTLTRPAPFQGGYSLVVNGNEFASRGRWDEAIIAWEQAVARNPKNDAALFNLALAHMNRQEFVKAEDFAIRAVNARHNDKYQEGLQQIREQASALDQNPDQRRDLHTTQAAQ